VDECLHVFGGYGYMTDFPIERAYRDARVGTIVAGTTEIMKEIIAKTVIDKVSYESVYENMRQGAEASAESAKPETPLSANLTNHKNTTTMATPETAREILYSLPSRLKVDKVDADTAGIFHFKMDGEGDFTITLKDKKVTVEEGLIGEPTCEVKAKAADYAAIELGKTNAQMAFMMGKIKISNLGEMMKFMGMFARIK